MILDSNPRFGTVAGPESGERQGAKKAKTAKKANAKRNKTAKKNSTARATCSDSRSCNDTGRKHPAPRRGSKACSSTRPGGRVDNARAM